MEPVFPLTCCRQSVAVCPVATGHGLLLNFELCTSRCTNLRHLRFRFSRNSEFSFSHRPICIFPIFFDLLSSLFTLRAVPQRDTREKRTCKTNPFDSRASWAQLHHPAQPARRDDCLFAWLPLCLAASAIFNALAAKRAHQCPSFRLAERTHRGPACLPALRPSAAHSGEGAGLHRRQS